MNPDPLAPPTGMTDWFTRFNASDTARRRAMLEALAWGAKAQLDALKGAFKSIDGNLSAIEDLCVFAVCAFFSPQARADLAHKMIPMLTEIAEPTGQEEHDRIHALIRNAVDRIDRSCEEDVDKPHPFPHQPDYDPT